MVGCGRKRLSTVLAPIVIMVSLVFAAAPIDSDASAGPNAQLLSVFISLTPDSNVAEVTTSQYGEATFGGNVTVEKIQGVERVSVSLNPSIDSEDWEIVVSRQTMVFMDSGTQAFQVMVIVPPATRVCSKAFTVTATASDSFSTDEASATATVRVGQFYKLDLSIAQTSATTVDPGDTITFDLRIENEGNGQDSFRIEIEDETGVLSDSEVVDTVSIQSGDFMDVEITLNIRDDFSSSEKGIHNILIHVHSLGSESTNEPILMTYPYYIFVETLSHWIETHIFIFVGYIVGLVIALSLVAYIAVRIKRRHDAETRELVERYLALSEEEGSEEG